MTIEELKQERFKCAEKIREAVEDFNRNTGLIILKGTYSVSIVSDNCSLQKSIDHNIQLITDLEHPI